MTERKKRKKRTLSLVLAMVLMIGTLSGNSAGGEAEILTLVTVKYSTIVVSLLPVLAVYPFMQRYFVKGVLIGGVKE